MLTKKQIFSKIRKWEYSAGEGFFDYFDAEISPANFMSWCRGKGLLTDANYVLWERAFTNNNITATSANYYIVGDEPFSIIQDDTEESHDKGVNVLAEFMEASGSYQERLINFIKNIHSTDLTGALREYELGNEMIVVFKDGTELRFIEGDGSTPEIPLNLLPTAKFFYKEKINMDDDEDECHVCGGHELCGDSYCNLCCTCEEE
jgi:hypothetical protein